MQRQISIIRELTALSSIGALNVGFKVTCASNFPLADLSQILHGIWVCYDIAKIAIRIGGHHINLFATVN